MLTWKNFYCKKKIIKSNYNNTELLEFFYKRINIIQYIQKYKKIINYKTQELNLKSKIIQKYFKLISNICIVLNNIQTNFFQSCFFFLLKIVKQDFLVYYTIYFSFSTSNTTLYITDFNGVSKVFYSAGLVKFTGKQKIIRKLVLVKFFSLLSFMKKNWIKKFPIALHLKNVGSIKFLIIKKLKKQFFIKIIKTFEQSAYNGCRKKKIRRKRQRKTIEEMAEWFKASDCKSVEIFSS